MSKDMKSAFFFMRIGFFDPESESISIGGIQTYIYDLANLTASLGYKPVVYEMNREGKTDCYKFENIEIRQISFSCKSYFQKSFDTIYKQYNKSDNIFIISTDQLSIKAPYNNVIAINHGIAFDEPICGIKGRIIKLLKCLKNVYRGQLVPNVVCVDYNFYNWFRTLATIKDESKFTVIPNYSQGMIDNNELNNKLNSTKQCKILFARRFVEHRGTKIFAEAIQKILNEFPNVEVTFAGSGPLENVLKEMFKQTNRVTFDSFRCSDSISFHQKYDIAVIPTIFSEGTSLSLCEAMSAGCFCIATRVGGLTNIIIDNYNGFLIEPTTEGIYKSLKEAISMDNDLFKRICQAGYDSACYGFSKKLWLSKWTKYIEDISKS